MPVNDERQFDQEYPNGLMMTDEEILGYGDSPFGESIVQVAEDGQIEGDGEYRLVGEEAVFAPIEVRIEESMTPMQARALENYFMGRRGMNPFFMGIGEEPKDVKLPKLRPSKWNKAKEWSISARALRSLIFNRILDHSGGYDYKFSAPYIERLKMFAVWNSATDNCIATFKETRKSDDTGKIIRQVIVRYRPNSFYASVFEQLVTLSTPSIQFVCIPSSNLGRHRNLYGSMRERGNKTKEGEMGFRMAQFRKNNKLAEGAGL